MKISEVARLSVKKDSILFSSMLGCDLISRLQHQEMQSKLEHKKTKKVQIKKAKERKR